MKVNKEFANLMISELERRGIKSCLTYTNGFQRFTIDYTDSTDIKVYQNGSLTSNHLLFDILYFDDVFKETEPDDFKLYFKYLLKYNKLGKSLSNELNNLNDTDKLYKLFCKLSKYEEGKEFVVDYDYNSSFHVDNPCIVVKDTDGYYIEDDSGNDISIQSILGYSLYMKIKENKKTIQVL